MKITNALVVKLVDTKDLKSLPFWECQFESGRGTTLLIDNLMQIISYKNKKSLKIKSDILKRIPRIRNRIKNILIVIGGDGFMLKTLKKHKNSKKLFYGINSGNYGFLMNKFSKNDFIKNILKSKMISISPLEIKVTTKKGSLKRSLAINEVSILRQSRQAAYLKVTLGKNNIIKNLISDGILVSTPAGSTAYNMSVHGPILGLDSKKLSISPISPFRPRRWKGKIVSDKSIIKIKNLDINKRPVSAVADNVEFRNAIKITVRTNKKIQFKLLYDANRSLQKKIKLELLRKEFK